MTTALIEGESGRFKRQGLGTEAVRFFICCTGYEIELPENDGIRKSDGNHLTSDGVAFVDSLRRKMDEGSL